MIGGITIKHIDYKYYQADLKNRRPEIFSGLFFIYILLTRKLEAKDYVPGLFCNFYKEHI